MHNLLNPIGLFCLSAKALSLLNTNTLLLLWEFSLFDVLVYVNTIRDGISKTVSQRMQLHFNVSFYFWKLRDVITLVSLQIMVLLDFLADQTIPRIVLRNRQFVRVRFPCRKFEARHFHGTRFSIFTLCETRNLESYRWRCIQMPGVAENWARASWSTINLFETLRDENQGFANSSS